MKRWIPQKRWGPQKRWIPQKQWGPQKRWIPQKQWDPQKRWIPQKQWDPPYAKIPFSLAFTLTEPGFTSNAVMQNLGEIYAPR